MQSKDFDLDKARGNWREIILDLTGISSAILDGKGHPCPICGGTDRFTFNDKDGIGNWFCRHGESHSDGKCGGTGYTLLKLYNNWDDPKVFQELKKYNCESIEEENRKIKLVPTYPTTEVWDKTTLVNRPKKIYNKSDFIWDWLTKNAERIGYVLRMDFSNGDKMVWQILYCDSELGKGWYQTAISKDKPLFGLETLKRSQRVLVVEGEKCQQIAVKTLSDWAVVCNQGGAAHIKISDWSPLKDKEVYIWPDNDKTGIEAANKIKEIVSHAKILTPIPRKRKGWDIANAIEEGWQLVQLEDYIVSNLFPGGPTEEDETEFLPALENSLDIEEPQKEIKLNELLNIIRPVGFNANFYYYCPIAKKQLIMFTADRHSSKTLMSIAPRYVWQKYFPRDERGNINWEAAMDFCLSSCHVKGVFDPMLVRGVGVWQDKEDLVVNEGPNLYVNKQGRAEFKKVEFTEYQSDYFYEQKPRRRWFDPDAQITQAEIQIILEATESIGWERPEYAYLAQGMLVQGVVCGAMPWRFNAWHIGSSGSGKTTIINSLYYSLWNPMCLFVEGDSTEPGIRRALKVDCIPVIFDEAENANPREDEARIMRILGLARQSSSGSASCILKADEAFIIKSCFLFSSIRTSLRNQADKSRTLVLELLDKNLPSKYEKFLETTTKITPELALKFRSHCIRSIPAILSRVEGFKAEFINTQLPPRLADQYAQAFACASVLQEMRVKAIEKLKENENYIEVIESSGSTDVLSTILNHQIAIPIDDRMYYVRICKAINILRSHTFTPTYNPNIDLIEDNLLAHGIKLTPNDKDFVYIANKNKKLEKILELSEWSTLLRKVSGAEATNSTCFGSAAYKCRAVKIPVAYLQEFDEGMEIQVENSKQINRVMDAEIPF